MQRLLAEGGFVATYKYALLQAIADLAFIHGDDSGAPITLPTRAIAEAIIGLYWRQAAPFPVTGKTAVLLQNTGGQAAIVSRLVAAQAAHGGSLPRLQQDKAAWSEQVSYELIRPVVLFGSSPAERAKQAGTPRWPSVCRSVEYTGGRERKRARCSVSK